MGVDLLVEVGQVVILVNVLLVARKSWGLWGGIGGGRE